ncbi:hypothetical protein ASPWEDRAFT_170787 [Aspergillus wentii DTO 134E9]|uniref:Short chain dehydrogenase/reductase family n=1 Tax=Aspergillus wentii DTO 134E9 TaxID=1073089 RepID=A0A1L9RQU4_ASPWE|nr:uncharacterized protein ASPWEDRAFT_170787 [Aspergillus wentii DTO 134E9]KAI9928215.1 hypothetical protein MW887_002248 [Aspergillus wentii]OJJ37301.1 hypothetical protein ASPWEDRAFT_170787 [Aspergillus wentii DTO 134E9]
MSHLEASQLFSVKDRVVVVTGAGSGLGRSMARALDINGAAKVFIIGRREDALKETAALGPNGSIVPIVGDVSSKESLESAYKSVAAQTDHVDVLFANSGIMGPNIRPPTKPDGSLPSLSEVRDELWSTPMSDFQKVFDINVTGAYYTVIAFLPLLEASNKKRPPPVPNTLSPPSAQVIITSSIAGFGRQVPFSFAYSLSKSTTNHLVKMLATVLSPYHIRVNGIAPGLYQSDMSQAAFDARGVQTSGTSEGSFPREMIPLTRAGSEEDISGLILWMASASGGYLNGTIIITDGGRVSAMPSAY